MSGIFGGSSTPAPAPVVQPAPVIRPAPPVSVPGDDEKKKDMKRVKKGVAGYPGAASISLMGGLAETGGEIKKKKLGGGAAGTAATRAGV